MRTKERLTLRGVCFALLVTAAVLRVAMLLGGQGGQAAALFFGLGLLPEQLRVQERPSVPADEPAATAEPTFPTLEYHSPARTLLFTAADAALVDIANGPNADLDPAALITQPISFDLTAEGPLVLIVHTHATESYTCADGDDYETDEPYHTEDTQFNVVRVGQALCDRLNEHGIAAVHDETLYDAAGYYDAYERTAEGIAAYLAQYPSIQMVIDVHRDSIDDGDGGELALTTTLGGQEAARLLLVMGTDIAGLTHPNWRENLSFAMQLQALCERDAPGLFRQMSLRSQRYNEHLTPHSILVEVGAAGNTLRQALRSVEFLADELTELLQAAGE
mgnify:CR=1 FL=1